MPGRSRSTAWLPWVLCWISLASMVSGVALVVAFPDEVDGGLPRALATLLGLVVVPPIGALIAARLPANPYGWLWSALGLAYGTLVLGLGLWRGGLVPGWSAGTVVGSAYLGTLGLLAFLLLLFPDGRLPGRRWRWAGRAVVVVAGAGILVLPFAPSVVEGAAPTPWALRGRAGDVLVDLVGGAVTVLFLLVVVAAGSLFVRWRRGGPVERQQLKWFLLAAAVAAGTTALDVFGVPVDEPLWGVVDGVALALLPVAVGIAVLRYRLYEIDRIISRTVSYGLLTAALVAGYLVLVAVLRPLLAPLTGSSALAVAGSTLAVAAVFNPARRRLQAAVDRRFDRARYDASRAVDAFAARLRDQVDLGEVTAGLRDTVAATVAPSRVAVWLRDAPSARGA